MRRVVERDLGADCASWERRSRLLTTIPSTTCVGWDSFFHSSSATLSAPVIELNGFYRFSIGLTPKASSHSCSKNASIFLLTDVSLALWGLRTLAMASPTLS